MFDLDHFKSINDNWGHEAGDTILVGFARILRKQVRADDLVVRMGGEEFLVLFSGCNSVDLSTGEVRVTASARITHFEPERDNFKQAYAKADHHLHEAKAFGRDRVVDVGTGERRPSPSTQEDDQPRCDQTLRLLEGTE